MSYIAYLDLLGTRGFCDDPNVYYNNVNVFNEAVIRTSSLLLDYGKVGVFSDSVYAGSRSLEHMLDFLDFLRNDLMSEGLFFNAVVKEGELGAEPITSESSNVFGVKFTDSGIADLYITQTNFKGVGIFVDPLITDEDVEGAGYETNRCIYMSRNDHDGISEWIPIVYRDISLRRSLPEKRRQDTALEIFLREFYASYMKAPKYGAYYISLLSNFVRSFGTDLSWDPSKKRFKEPPLVFEVIYRMVTTESKLFSGLPGLDFLVFAMLDMVYESTTLNEHDLISITKEYANIEFIRQKYFHNLNDVPRNLFGKAGDESHWARFVRYCQDDFANEFIENVMSGGK